MCPVVIGSVIAGAVSSAMAATSAAIAAATAIELAMVAAAVISAGAGIYQAVSSASAQDKQAEEKYKQQERQNEAAAAALTQSFADATAQKMEIQTKAGVEKKKIEEEGLKSQASAKISAGEAGVAGLSIDNMMSSIERSTSNGIATLDANLSSYTQQVARSNRTSRLKAGARQDTSRVFYASSVGKTISSASNSAFQVAGVFK